MPIYEYRCDNGHVFEVMQRMSDDPLSSCGTCGSSVRRVFHPVAVHFKGSGFYATDYGKNKPKGTEESKPKSDSDDSSKGSSDSSKGSSDSAGGSGKESSNSKPKAGASDSKA